MGTESRLVIARFGGKGEKGVIANGAGFLGGDENVLPLHRDDDCTTL